MSLTHKTRPVQVWADVDLGIADMVVYLNTIPGVRTEATSGDDRRGRPGALSRSGLTIWPAEVFERLKTEFDITILGENWGYLHPRAS